jgi:hypothetical protein
MKFLSDIRLLLLAIWLGAAVFFIGVAMSVFAVVPERETAGAVVNRTLSILNFGGMAVGVILVLTSLIGGAAVNKMWLWVERFLLLLIAASSAIGQFVIGLWLSALRVQMGRPIDEVPVDDPLRIQFNSLHEYSTWVLFAAMGAALVAFFIIANRKFGASTAKTADVYDFSKEFKV